MKASTLLLTFAGMFLGGAAFNAMFKAEPNYIKVYPQVVASLYNKHALVFTAVATNDAMFYLSEPTNGTFLKMDYVWGKNSGQDAAEHVRYKK